MYFCIAISGLFENLGFQHSEKKCCKVLSDMLIHFLLFVLKCLKWLFFVWNENPARSILEDCVKKIQKKALGAVIPVDIIKEEED